MNKNILLITERFAPDLGGVATSSKRVVENFCELGAEVCVFSWTKSLPAGELESTKISTDTGSVADVYRLGLFGNFDFSLQYSFNIFEWLFSKHNFDLVWGHYLFPSGFVAVTIAELFGKPSVVSARGNDIDRLIFPPGDFARLHWTLERASHVTAVSKELGKKIDVILGRKNVATILGNVVNITVFRPHLTTDVPLDPDKKLFFDTQSPILGFCGELRQKKGLPFLLQTFHQLNQSLGAKLLIIGAVRSRENNELTDFLGDHPHLANQLLVTGHVDSPFDVCQFINCCDVMLFPSLWDGVPNSILESMAGKTIVVASDAGGIGEVITHNQTGFLVSRHSLASFPEQVEKTLALPVEEKKRIQANAREFCKDLWEKKNHLSILQKIIESNTEHSK